MSMYIFPGTTDEGEDYRKKLYEMSQAVQNPPKAAISSIKTKTKSRLMTEEEIAQRKVDTKEHYQKTEKGIKDENRGVVLDNFLKWLSYKATNANAVNNGISGNLTPEKAESDNKIVDLARDEYHKSRKIKNDYSEKLGDLDNARRQVNMQKERQAIVEVDGLRDEVARLYNLKSLVDADRYSGISSKNSTNRLEEYNSLYESIIGRGYNVDNLFDAYTEPINKERQEAEDKKTSEYTTSSVPNAIKANVGSVGLNVVGGIASAPSYINSFFKELVTGEPHPVDLNAPEHSFANMRDTIRSTTDEEIQKNIDNKTLKGIASFAYQTGMSVADFLSVSWMPQPASLAIMATNAGTSAAKQVVENGGTTSQALMTGLAAGTAEVLFEKLSLDKFSALQSKGGKGFKTIATNILKQSGVEGTEELFTDIANRVSDDLINGGLSQYNLAVEQYKAEGLAEDEARKKANTDFAKQLGLSFAGGALSGSVIGSVGSSIGNARYNNYTKSVGKDIQATNNVQATVDRGLTADTNSKVYKLALETADKMKNGEKVSPYNIGNLHNEITSTNLKKNIQPAVQDRLTQLNAKDNDNAIMNAVLKKINGEKVSMTDNGIIENSPVAKRVISEYENSYNNQFTNNWVNKAMENDYVSNSTKADSLNIQENVPQEGIEQTFNLADINSNTNEESQPNKSVANISAKPSTVRLLDSGEEVKIKEIEKASNGKVVLKTSNNKHITLEQVEFSSSEAEQVYKTAMQMPSKGTADRFIRSYNANKEDGGTANLQLFTEAFKRMYDAGRQGESLDKKVKKSGYIANGSISLLSASQAFFAGQEEANRANSVIIGSKKYDTGVTNLSKTPLSKAQVTQIEILNNISKATGASIVVADGITDEKGFVGSFGAYKDGTIYINVAKVGDGINYTAGHELVHFIKSENAELYKKLEKVVVNELKSSDNYNFDEQVQNKINQYWKAGQQLTRAEAIEEIVAESCFNVLSNEQSVLKIVETDWKLARKIKDWLSDFIAKLKEVAEKIGRGRPEYKALHDNIEALENINEAFYSALNGIKNTDTNSDGEVKYSIETVEGTDKKYVKADRQVIRGSDVNQWKRAVKDYINNEIRQGKDVKFTAADGDMLTITSNTAGKATFRNEVTLPGGTKRRMTNKEFASKLRAETHIDELSQVSERGEKTVPDYKQHSFAKDGFNYRTAYFEDVDGQYYKVTISVGINGDINSVYNVGKMQNKKRKTSISGSKAARKTALESLSNTNISQSENGVNSHSMQNEKKDTNIKYMINSDFNRQYDEWDKTAPEVHFTVGRTSEALKSIGVKEQEIVWDGSKIIKTKAKHKNMSDDIIKQVPFILESPIIVMNSLSYSTRLTLFGEVYDTTNNPVLVVIELKPTTANKIALDEIKIASTYGKDNPQSLINRSSILYIEPNKKRTDEWLSSNRLQLPVGENHYGSIDRISYDESSVKNYSMQEAKKDTKFMLPTTENDDSDIQLYRNQQYISENKALKKQVEILKKRVDFFKKELTLTNGNKLSEKSIESFTRTMLNKYKSDYDFEAFKGELTELFEYIANADSADYDNIVYQGSKIAKSMLERSSTLNKDLWNESKSFREYLKNTKIALSEAQKNEVANYYGSYDSFRKSLFGSVAFANDGIALEELWSEISNRPDFGYYFDGNTNELDQPIMLKQFIENVKPTYKDTFDGMDMDTASLGVGLEIYDAYFDIPKSVTFADKKKQEIKSLRKQYREQMSKWKADYKKEYSDKLIQTKKELKEKAKAIKSDALIKQKSHYKTVQKNARERRNNTAVRHKILNVHSRLTSMLSQNTETKHVPVELIKSVVDVLEALNLNTMQDSIRKEDLYLLYANAKSDEERAEIQDRIDRLTKREENLKTKLLNASDRYSELKETDSYTMQSVYDDTIGEDIAELKRVIGDTPVNKLSTAQLEMTYTVFKEIEHTVRKANKAFKDEKGETIEKMGSQVLDELSELKKPGAKLDSMNKLGEQGWALLTPIYAMRHIGSQTLSSAYSKIRDGQNVWALDLDEAQRFAQSHYNSTYTNKKSLKKSHVINLRNGEKIGITIDEAMSIYAYSRREQGVKHLLGGGFQFAHNVSKETVKANNKLEEKVNKHLYYFKTSPFKLTIEDINAISILLTDEQKTYVKNMQDYLSDVMGAKGNEVSMAMYGIKKFNEKNYFPLKSSRDFLAVKNENPQDSKLKKRSFTNKTIANANNPIVLEEFSSVWSKHVNEMAMYHGFALPIEDFTRVYNFKTRVTEDSSGQSVINELGSLFGNGATSYINHFLSDINGNARSDPDTSIPAKALTTFKKGATFLSASVGIQQASAIGRALYLIDPKYFAKVSTDKTSIFKPETWEEAKKYAPVAIIKEMGHFDMNMGRSTSDWLMQPEYSLKEKPVAFIKDSNYRDDLLSLFPSKSDEYTWCAIWNAVQSEVQDKQGLKIGTEENKIASGKRFSEVIDMTQVYDSTLSRSQLMRNKNVYISMATSFMSEPTVSLNMLNDGLYQAKRNGKEGKKIFARAVGAWLFSEFLNALLKSIVTAGRDDDEYDKYREKYIRHFFDNLSSGLFIPNLVPYVKDIVSVFQGYDIERADMTVVQDAYNAVTKICDKDIAWGEKVLETVKTVSVFFGIPLKNAIRDAKIVGNVANGFKLDKELNSIDYKYAMKEGLLSGLTGEKYTPTGHFKRLYEAKRNGDKKTYDEIYHILKQSGKTDKKIVSGLRASMAENDERIIEAAKKKDKGDFVGYAKITQEIRAGGFEYNDVAKAVNSALTKLRKNEVEEYDNNEQRVSLYSYDDLNGAIENGDSEAVDLIVQEKIETKLANGGTEKDAKKAIKAQLTSYWKPEYIGASANERVEIRNKLLSTGVYDNMSDLNDLLARWRKEAE